MSEMIKMSPLQMHGVVPQPSHKSNKSLMISVFMKQKSPNNSYRLCSGMNIYLLQNNGDAQVWTDGPRAVVLLLCTVAESAMEFFRLLDCSG